ncbi:MAG: hypothetical protein U9O65_09020, partial [Thermotogota bacterium]|nr:hypothetical protein [Thermotogota bacterium]
MVAEYKQDDNYLVLEVSNEIANKIGGIYTVIASKAPDMLQLLGEGNYYTIGLFNAFKARADFEELPLPDYFSKTLSQVKKQGITVKFGRWKGGGGVKTFLVDPSHLLDFPVVTGKTERKIDQIKGVLWDWFNI